MKIQGIITNISKKIVNARAVFYVQLDSNSAKELNRGALECSYFNSKLSLHMPVILEGEIKNDRFEVYKLKPYYSRADQVVRYMVHKIKGCGIGKKRVEAIVNQFEASIFTMPRSEFKKKLENDFKGGISAKSIGAFLDAWYTIGTISELEEFFAPYEVKYSSIEKIDEEYKDKAVAKIKKNPYAECLKFDIKRQVAESIAKDIKITAYDRKRVAGLISYALVSAENEGHTYMNAEDLVIRVNRFSLKSPYKCRIPIVCIANEVTINRTFYLDQNKGYVSFTLLHNEEINIAIRLRRINEDFKSYITVEDTLIDEIEQKLGTHYAPGQRSSFRMLNCGGINILTGGPGTGKTTTICGIIMYYKMKNPGKNVLLCAPTGSAAKRLSESTNMEAKTIHKLLEFKPFQGSGVERNNNNPLDAGLIIVDEMSMCDTHLLNMLLNAVPKDCRVIFVGDENQLPSVGAGNCLHDMIDSGLFEVYRLTENFRSEGSIIENGKRILKGKMPKKDFDFEIYRSKTESQAYNGLISLMNQYYKKEDPFYCQMIEASKKGPAGCDAINNRMHKEIHKRLGKKEEISDDLMVDDKIMFIRNEYETKYDDGESYSIPLYANGEIAIIRSLDDDEVVIYDDSEERVMKRSVLNDARLCYSYTIHKSQGSENSVVIIYLSGDDNVKVMMNRNLLYTAVTRAKKKVILVYTGDSLESCLKNEHFIIRKTRLCEFLLQM